MAEIRFGGRCSRHPLNILPCEKCAAEHAEVGGCVDVVAKLQRMVQERGSQKAVATALDISEQYLCDVLRDRREPGEKLLDALGLERVVTYRAKGSSGVKASDPPLPEYGSTDYGYTIIGPHLTEGDKRLMALLVRGLGSDHPAVDDLTALILRAGSRGVPERVTSPSGEGNGGVER
jgi:hypothetical protein